MTKMNHNEKTKEVMKIMEITFKMNMLSVVLVYLILIDKCQDACNNFQDDDHG